MPNWVTNDLTIEGYPDIVEKLQEQVSRPYTMPVEAYGDLSFKVVDKQVNSVFSFWNIIAPTDLEAYPTQPDFNDRGSDNSWYNWNIRNWGVKWDTTNVDLVNEEHDEDNALLVYTFETPWGIPSEAIIELSRQFPSLQMTLDYREETGWGGQNIYLNGTEIENSEYGWQCWECDHTEPESPWCEECEYDTCPKCGHNESSEECDEHHLLNQAFLLTMSTSVE